jgi:surface carbohydrate biosynthesis protein
MKKRIIFIPVETISRELDYKIVLASNLLSKDNIIFLGQHDFLDSILGIFKSGSYIGKHVFKDSFPSPIDLYQKYKRNNFSILWTHEEGGIYAGNRKNWKKVLDELLDPSVLMDDDAVLTWGEFQKNHYSEKSTITPINVGVPRFNLSKESNLRAIIKKFNRVKEKDYVLINTNFSTVNYHSDREEMLLNLINSFKSETDNIQLAKHFASQNKIFSHFIELVTDLALKHPNQLFIFRPHPTESSKIYKLLFSSLSNVKVTKQFSAVEWMDQCKCLIQNGCTTSLEAYFMGKRVVNFFPFEDKDSINVTKELGISCSTIQEVESIVFNEIDSPQNPLNTLEELPELIKNLNSDYQEDIFTKELIKLVNTKDLFSFNMLLITLRIQATSLLVNIVNAIKYIPRYLLFKAKWKDYQMAVSHFPGFSKSEVTSKFNLLSEESSQEHNLKFFGKNLVMVSQKLKND